MKKLKSHHVVFDQIIKFLAGAERKLGAARKILALDEEAAYKLAHEAMLKGSLGYPLSFGVRPRSLPGHHMTIIEFAGKHLGKEFKSLMAMFNRMRRKRHDTIYAVNTFISKSEAEQALETAATYLTIIRDEILKKNPQKELL